MPPALQAVLTSSGVTLGLQSSIRPLTRSVTAGPGGIRGSAPHHGIELWRSYNASGLADPGCPVSPSLHHHPRNPVRSCGWLSRQRQPSLGISRRGSAWPRRCARSCWPWRAAPRWSAAHEKAGKPGRTDLLLAPRPAEMGARAVHQQAPDIAVAELGDAPQSLLATTRSLLRDQIEPGCKL